MLTLKWAEEAAAATALVLSSRLLTGHLVTQPGRAQVLLPRPQGMRLSVQRLLAVTVGRRE